jgi:RHH-type transcriptional regulator, proline utilization regulon repressor / proline dehydrogenase / delta 1-pyrroline-5-carboxylate dehydrogenase
MSAPLPPSLATATAAVAAHKHAPEAAVVERLRAALPFDAEAHAAIEAEALRLAAAVRNAGASGLSAERFLGHFGLTTREGVALMCLAEALLRVPDEATVDRLIADKLAGTEWSSRETGESLLMNAAAWGLMLTGRLYDWRASAGGGLAATLSGAVRRLGEPVARGAVRQAMRIMAEQFVVGETIESALAAAPSREEHGFKFTYDMLGEAARTAADADRYATRYAEAIDAVSRSAAPGDVLQRASVSVKLSALHPRYEPAQRDRVLAQLLPRLRHLALAAKAGGIALVIDAEEIDRLALQLELFGTLAADPALAGWDGLGFVAQAYLKCAPQLCEWAIECAHSTGRRIPLRLVKGAYWDAEIKHAQTLGLPDYPVFTRKAATDLSFLVCAERLLAAPREIFPSFATHNCHTVAVVRQLARAAGRPAYEFQKLQGMGDALYEALQDEPERVPVRIYAPVGDHRDLLAYLVRRLLENGANSSFVHQIADPKVPLARLASNPVARLPMPYATNPRVPLPANLYPDRRNSEGIDLADRAVLDSIARTIGVDRSRVHAPDGSTHPVMEPGNLDRMVGSIAVTVPEALDTAIARARDAFPAWTRRSAEERARILEEAADTLEATRLGFVSLLAREAGKTWDDGVAEVREAVDFCRYYATEARHRFAPQALPGPTGESNRLTLHGRGVFACISPWNFPLAIFTGQVVAALAAGNTVVAKPAEQTPLVARRMVAMLHEAGVPADALALAIGTGDTIGARLVADPRIAGAAFTGSVETAHLINRSLANRGGAIVPLIAETGGLNAMIVDSTALTEQVAADVITSAFRSAGQRCSALRILALQEDSADRVIEMLSGAMSLLRLGDPAALGTDVGPVIDADALAALEGHRDRLAARAKLVGSVPRPPNLPRGHYFAPVAFEVDGEDLPDREVFGPILHIVRYERTQLPQLLARLAAPGYGLTLGIASRIDSFVDEVVCTLHAGNTYVNRNMIGAVVGVQPFGGEGLSGTGFKAGGPHYLLRFALERTLTVNTTAVGGNAALLAGDE